MREFIVLTSLVGSFFSLVIIEEQKYPLKGFSSNFLNCHVVRFKGFSKCVIFFVTTTVSVP